MCGLSFFYDKTTNIYFYFFLLYKNTLCRVVINDAYLFIQCNIYTGDDFF